MRRRRRTLAVLVALALSAACEVAHAEPEAQAAPVGPAYTLEVDSDAPDVVSFEALSARVGADLGAPIARAGDEAASRAAITIRYRGEGQRLTVRVEHLDGRVLERSVEAKGDAADVQNEAVLLASNLARDEARELLDALAARRPAPSAPAIAPPPPRPARPPPAPEDDGFVPVAAALVYPLATNWGRPGVRTWIDLSLLYGRVGEVRGASIGSAVAHASRGVTGAQIAGALGLSGRVTGAQIAGAVAIATERVRGAQIAPGLTLATRGIEGAQIAPVDVASEVDGVQIGVVNVARRVRGVQIGIVNVAEEVDGAALGIVSVSRGGIHGLAYASTVSYANAGVKFSSRYAYTFLALAYGNPETDFEARVGVTAGLGAHVPLPARLDVEIEGAITNLAPNEALPPARESPKPSNTWAHARALPGYSFAPHLRVFAGGGVRIPIDVDVGRSVVRPEVVAGVQF